MKSLIALSTFIVLSLSIMSLSQDRLSRSEILEIVEQLIQEQRTAWIQTGTLEVWHTEYRAPLLTEPEEIEAKIQQDIAGFESNPGEIIKTEDLQAQKRAAIPFNVRYKYANETTTMTYEIIKVDQDLHSQDIIIESRTESVRKPASLTYNEMTEDLDLNGNQRRIFAWDGQNYTLYNLPINIAIVDAANRFTQAGIAALKAGLIPWGEGLFSKQNLMDAQISGQVAQNGELAITFVWDSGMELTASLDSKRSFALQAYSLTRPDGTVNTGDLLQYRNVNKAWIPKEIITARYSGHRLLEQDQWELIDVSTETPRPGAFSPEYLENASVSHYSPVSDKPLRYHYNSRVDTHALLARRLDVETNGNNSAHNCATLCMAYAAEKLGRPIPDQQLTDIVDSGLTTLLQLKSLALSLGLSAEVVKTDIPGLAQRAEEQVLLHLPGKNHFVVLDHIDGEDIWVVDLLSRRFYYPINFNRFTAAWSEGVALILSNDPISLAKSDTIVTDAGARGIVGGKLATCTNVKQAAGHVLCDSDCTEYYYYMFKMMGCVPRPQDGCYEELTISGYTIACTQGVHDCEAGPWWYDYLDACQEE